ncbi:MAG: hypothetical protein ACKVT2_05125 [Saprospiraceae bacterium]
MTIIRCSLLLAFVLVLQNCAEKAPELTRPLNSELIPTDAKPIPSNVYKVNCWVEQEKFNAVGVCTNTSAGWQKIWLEAAPLNAAGKPISISKCSSVFLATFSDAVPPNGRTSFFFSWPLADFSEKPDSFSIKSVVASPKPSGPILVVPFSNGLQMFSQSVPGQPSMEGWHVSGSLSNPLEMESLHPRLEVLVYGTDRRLWLSTVLNPEEPNARQIYQTEVEGPLKPGEERPFRLQVYYQALPKPLQDQKIGNVEILPFEARM